MSLELRPVSAPAPAWPARDAAGAHEGRRLPVWPAGADEAGDGCGHAQGGLAVGAASDVCGAEVPGGRGVAAGGHFTDVVFLGGDRVALVLGDVRGDPAARSVPQVRNALRLILTERAPPARVLGWLNRYLCSWGPPAARSTVAVSLAVVDAGTGQTVCACAGSEPPLILRAGGGTETVSASITALGVDPWRTYRAVDFLLGRGDTVLMATDGITGSRRADGGGGRDLLGYEGLAGLALGAFGTGAAPGQVARAVLDGARAFAGGPVHDACVLVAARR